MLLILKIYIYIRNKANIIILLSVFSVFSLADEFGVSPSRTWDTVASPPWPWLPVVTPVLGVSDGGAKSSEL